MLRADPSITKPLQPSLTRRNRQLDSWKSSVPNSMKVRFLIWRLEVRKLNDPVLTALREHLELIVGDSIGGLWE